MRDIIEHAVKGGFDDGHAHWFVDMCDINGWESAYTERLFTHTIFSHDFLKAFFGDYEQWNEDGTHRPHWQYHAQQLVLAENRIEYLRGFLNER